MSLKTLLVCDDPTEQANIKNVIDGQQALALLEIVSRTEIDRKIQSLLPELVWIDLNQKPVMGLATLAQLHKAYPAIFFVVSYKEADSELIRTAYRLGASDYMVPSSWQHELPEAVQRIHSKLGRQANSRELVKTSAKRLQKIRPLVTLLICDADKNRRQNIEDLISQHKQLGLSATVTLARAEEKAYLLHPKVIWLELSPDPSRALSVLANLKQNCPDAHILVSNPKPEAEVVIAAFRNGASDFLDAQRQKTDLKEFVKRIQPGAKPGRAALLFTLMLILIIAASCWCVLAARL